MLREWAKRILRALAATAVFDHPSARALEEQEAAEKAAREAAEKAAAKEAAGNGAYDDGIINSSSSSEAGDVGNLLPVSLPTNMYLPGGAKAGVRPALPPASAAFTAAQQERQQQGRNSLGESPSLGGDGGFASGQVVATGGPSNTFGNSR